MAHAPVVKWISQRSSEPLLWVRVLPGAQHKASLCVPGRKQYIAFCQDSKAAAMFCDYTKPRGGVEEFSSDGEKISVTEPAWYSLNNKLILVRIFLLFICGIS